MNPIEIVGGVLLLISSVLIILIVMMQSGRESNMSASLTGTQADSYLGRNQSRTKQKPNNNQTATTNQKRIMPPIAKVRQGNRTDIYRSRAVIFPRCVLPA